MLEKLPANKVEELWDFGAVLLPCVPVQQKPQNLADHFAGVWQDDRTAEEIIADIRQSRIDIAYREPL